MLEISFSNISEAKRVPMKTLYQQLATFTNDLLQIQNHYMVSVTLVDEQKIREINSSYRQIDKATDVISFAFLDYDDKISNHGQEILLGDIYIAYHVALKQAKEYGHSLKRELCFLFIHGLLHLLGYDHQSKEEEEKMVSFQEEILNHFKIKREDL